MQEFASHAPVRLITAVVPASRIRMTVSRYSAGSRPAGAGLGITDMDMHDGGARLCRLLCRGGDLGGCDRHAGVAARTLATAGQRAGMMTGRLIAADLEGGSMHGMPGSILIENCRQGSMRSLGWLEMLRRPQPKKLIKNMTRPRPTTLPAGDRRRRHRHTGQQPTIASRGRLRAICPRRRGRHGTGSYLRGSQGSPDGR